MDNPQEKRPVSPRKLAANRSNAQRSTGPTTEAGKANAAQNSYRHGFFALRLFPNAEIRARDGADYDAVFKDFDDHYSPVGGVEKFWLEKAATDALRLARLLGFEQQVLSWPAPFEERSVDRLLRYESTISRHFAQAIKNLELLQEKRKAESKQPEPTDPEPDHATSEPYEATLEPSATPVDPAAEDPASVSTSGNASDASLIVRQENVEVIAKEELAPTHAEPPNERAETPVSNPPLPENCGTNPLGSSRFVETPEDQLRIDAFRQEEPEDPDLLE
jgi:hypothetical protein